MSEQLPTVLVVDDDQLMRDYAVNALNRLGYVAAGRSTIESAVEFAKATASLRLVLCDICLGSDTGPDLIRRVLWFRPELKVVFMSGGYSNISFRHTDPLIDKPFSLQRLREAIESALHESRGSMAPPPAALAERRRPMVGS
jgi:DNA-binding NtrC family response regulator